jgi:lysophospholipase L1-like esterase
MITILKNKSAGTIPRSRKMLSFASALLLGSVTLANGADKGIAIQNGQKIAFLGDSITANGWGMPGGYVRLVVDGLEKEGVKVVPIPAGVSGNTSKDMLARLGRDVLDKKPDWMTLSCGVNDVWHGVNGVDLETYKTNITSIVDQATTQGIKVVILTSTPISEEDNANNQKLAAYNDFLRGLAKARKLPLADLNANFQAVLKTTTTSPASRNLTVDGVHMNPDGNVVMAEGVLDALGVSKDETAKIEQEWLTQPGTAFFAIGNYDPRPNGVDLSLQQFRDIEKVAQARGLNFEQLDTTLWLQTLGQVIQNHAQDPVLDPNKIRDETNALLVSKLEELLKAPAPKTGA